MEPINQFKSNSKSDLFQIQIEGWGEVVVCKFAKNENIFSKKTSLKNGDLTDIFHKYFGNNLCLKVFALFIIVI